MGKKNNDTLLVKVEEKDVGNIFFGNNEWSHDMVMKNRIGFGLIMRNI